MMKDDWKDNCNDLKALLTEARVYVATELDCILESHCYLDKTLEPIRSTLPPHLEADVNELDLLLCRIDEATSSGAGAVSRAQLGLYADVIKLWEARFDAMWIAERVGLPELVVATWIANWKDLRFGGAA